MRMIVDSNYLQAEALRTYLAASTQHYAVLTDYASMEAYKADPQVIFHSMRILDAYPNQVIILKSTSEVCGLGPVRSADSLIDHKQTQGFPVFCQRLAQAGRGDPSLQRQLSQLQREAASHIDRMLTDIPQLNLGFGEIQASFTPDELTTLRRAEQLTPPMCAKFSSHLFQLAGYLFSTHPEVTTVPRGPEVRDTFIFRHAICAYLLALEKITQGSAGRTAHPKLRNDLIDANFATFGTFFDGLLSADKAAQRIYFQAGFLLREVFTMPACT
jgi:hypothetical protein